MANCLIQIGFVKTIEIEPGVWENQSYERSYVCRVLSNSYKWSREEKITEDLSLSNRFSVVCDATLQKDCGYMKYIVYLGNKWTVNTIKMNFPRLEISVGGLYNE